jgi:hypothetical protein
MLSDTYIPNHHHPDHHSQKSEIYITPIFLTRHNISILFNDSWGLFSIYKYKNIPLSRPR